MTTETTPVGAGESSPPTAGSPFVFLDDQSRPFLVFRGWLHYWHADNKWVTLRETKPGERETLEARKLPDDRAALYGWPCTANARLHPEPPAGGDRVRADVGTEGA